MHNNVLVPPTPTPVGRTGRDGSKILGVNANANGGADDDAVDDEAEDRDRDGGEGPSRIRLGMVRRIDWGQAGGEEPEHQCEYRVRITLQPYPFVNTYSSSEPLMLITLCSTNSKTYVTNSTKKSHDEKTTRSEHEALSALHGAILAQRDALSRERDAIREDRDAVVVERNYVTRERDALQVRNGALEGENAILVGEKERLEGEKAECVGEVGRLGEQIVQLQRDLDELRGEKMEWEEEKVRDGLRRRDMEEQIRILEQQVWFLSCSLITIY